jgi:protoheme ferro-lyase
MKILLGFVVFIIAVSVFYTLLAKYKNRRLKPDYYEEFYKVQDSVPEGKVGIFVTGLIMPEKMDYPFFYNITQKIFNAIIPWPFRLFSKLDKGVALLDDVKYHEHEEFTPARLVDQYGNDRDIDGEPFIEKYKKGEVVWQPPSKRIYLDHGYFLYTGHKAGLPSLSGKTLNKANLWYYNLGIKQQKLPHWQGSFAVINGARDKIFSKYSNVEFRAENSLDYYNMKKKLFELLNAGCETIVLAAPMPIYSHFEEFNSSFRHSMEYINEWKAENPNKKVKVIMAPPMGHFQPMRQAFVDMLKDRLDTLPKGAGVTVAVTVHGMPWDYFSWEAWLELAPPFRDKLFEDVKELLKAYTFSKTNVVICQDEFSDPVWDPKEKYLSTNRAYRQAIKEGYDYVIGLPIEFIAENSDTLFHHALKNYHGFDAYNVYEQIDYPDWSIPYTREFKQDKTSIIYNGVPVGKYQKHVIRALYESLDSVLSKKR